LSGGSAARRATRSFTGSLWMTLSSSRSPVLQLRLSLNPFATKNRLRRQGAGVTPVTLHPSRSMTSTCSPDHRSGLCHATDPSLTSQNPSRRNARCGASATTGPEPRHRFCPRLSPFVNNTRYKRRSPPVLSACVHYKHMTEGTIAVLSILVPSHLSRVYRSMLCT